MAGHNTELIREKRMHLLEEKLGEAMGDAKQMGLSFDEIVEIMRLLYEGGE